MLFNRKNVVYLGYQKPVQLVKYLGSGGLVDVIPINIFGGLAARVQHDPPILGASTY